MDEALALRGANSNHSLLPIPYALSVGVTRKCPRSAAMGAAR